MQYVSLLFYFSLYYCIIIIILVFVADIHKITTKCHCGLHTCKYLHSSMLCQHSGSLSRGLEKHAMEIRKVAFLEIPT